MNKTWTVAWREFRHTVLTKAFVIGVVIAPLCFGVIMIFASIFLQPEAKPLVGTIAVISPDDVLIAPLRESLQPEKPHSLPDIKGLTAEEATDVLLSEASASTTSQVAVTKMDIDIVSMNATQIDEIKKGIRDGSYTALVVVDEQALDLDGKANENRVRIYVSPDSPPSHTELLESSSRTALIEARLSDQGLDPVLVQRLTARPRVTTVRLVEGGDEKMEIGDLRRFLPMAFMMLVWITTFISGNYLLTSTIEEKSNRVMEVLLSAVSPMELMTGKILGYAMVTVIMVAMFSTVLIAGLIFASVLDLITPMHLVLLPIYLVMAYLMIAAIMAGIGSAVSDLRDAQTLLGPVSFAVMIPLFLMTIIAEEPNGTVALVTTYIPPLTPFLMILRILATEPINPTEIIFSIVWGFTCAIVMIWIASRIFRIGVLMQGKPPNPIEMLRWIRYR